jgi:hypothetical protein
MEDFLTSHYYRFRPVSALLDSFHELENQEIYFPTCAELNDPLEGFKDIFWRGDRIIWRNLFRHYLLCLMQSVSLTALAGKEFTLELVANLIFQTDADLPAAPVLSIYTQACETFFNNGSVDVLLDNLSNPEKFVKRAELIFYLTLIHSFAVTTVLQLFEEHGFKLITSTKGAAEYAAKTADNMNSILDLPSFTGDQADELYFIHNNIFQQLSLLQELTSPITDDRRSWLFVIRDFPSHYVTALERLLYPDWHAACFVTDPTQASMWGHYGEGHQGMCLKFRAKPNDTGVASLDLYRATSWGSNNTTGYSYVPHAFEAIEYTAEFPEIDFFASLGRLPVPKLSNFWYAGQNGEHSEIAARVLGGGAQWREDYWRQFPTCYRTKLPQWAHENEHRLILHSIFDDLATKESRKIKYHFNDLTGIIFGIKTTTASKIAAMRIIERKCVEMRRNDFEFWQAHYSRRTRKIEISKLDLIRISPYEAPP